MTEACMHAEQGPRLCGVHFCITTEPCRWNILALSGLWILRSLLFKHTSTVGITMFLQVLCGSACVHMTDSLLFRMPPGSLSLPAPQQMVELYKATSLSDHAGRTRCGRGEVRWKRETLIWSYPLIDSTSEDIDGFQTNWLMKVYKNQYFKCNLLNVVLCSWWN